MRVDLRTPCVFCHVMGTSKITSKSTSLSTSMYTLQQSEHTHTFFYRIFFLLLIFIFFVFRNIDKTDATISLTVTLKEI